MTPVNPGVAAFTLAVFVLYAVGIEDLRQVLRSRASEGVVRSRADPQQLHGLVRLFGTRKERCVSFHKSAFCARIHTAAPDPNPRELIEMARCHRERLTGAHGQPCDRAALAICQHMVLL